MNLHISVECENTIMRKFEQLIAEIAPLLQLEIYYSIENLTMTILGTRIL